MDIAFAWMIFTHAQERSARGARSYVYARRFLVDKDISPIAMLLHLGGVHVLQTGKTQRPFHGAT